MVENFAKVFVMIRISNNCERTWNHGSQLSLIAHERHVILLDFKFPILLYTCIYMYIMYIYCKSYWIIYMDKSGISIAEWRKKLLSFS